MCARMQLAVAHRNQGNIDTAMKILTETHGALSGSLGNEHLYSLCGAIELSNTYGGVGDFLAAHQLGAATLDALTRLLGGAHPFVLAQAVNVCLDSYRGGKTRSLNEHRAAVRAFASIAGENHPAVRKLSKLERFSPDIDVMPW
jgi:hypothetical protein